MNFWAFFQAIWLTLKVPMTFTLKVPYVDISFNIKVNAVRMSNGSKLASACFYYRDNYPNSKKLCEGKQMAELRTQEQQLLSTLESLGGTATVDPVSYTH